MVLSAAITVITLSTSLPLTPHNPLNCPEDIIVFKFILVASSHAKDPQRVMNYIDLDSIAVSLFGNLTVEPGEIHLITKECQYQNKRSK